MKGTLDFGLGYPKRKNLTFKTYTNVDWARSVDDKNSTNENSFFLVVYLVSWLRKRQ